MNNWTKSFAIAIPLWGFTLVFSGCEEAVSLPAETCKEMIKETACLFDMGSGEDDKGDKVKEERSSLGSIRFDLLSLLVLVHSRQDIAPDDEAKVPENTGK